jgi:hypothetical protein
MVCCTSPKASPNGKALPARRRVAFASDLPSLIVPATTAAEEKQWLTKPDIIAALQSHSLIVKESSAEKTFPLYLSSLATSYAQCCSDASDSAIPVSLDPYQVSILAMSANACRGIEANSLSGLANDRRMRRQRHATLVKQCHAQASQLCPDGHQRDEILRQVSLKLSASSRKFAQVLGAADAIVALVEQTATSQSLRRPIVHKKQAQPRAFVSPVA